ncbi:glycosyltransferase [Pseudooceanicola sp.]|uniref:glycosyltransferase n=1 Tax=Pseudooceanicola sp. TaxID=1914328 RepID=UPI00405876B0
MADFNGFQMVGVCRFSVLSTDFTTQRRGTPEEIAERIFQPAAMELRFKLFEALTWATLSAQTDPDFKLVILTSEEMPKRYLDRLRDVTASHPGTEVWAAPIDRHYKLLRMSFDRVAPDGSGHRLSFRIDDDDAVDLEMVQRAKSIARRLVDFQRDEVPSILCWNKGFYFDLNAEDESQLTDTFLRAPLAIGNTLIHRPGDGHNPYRYNHKNFAAHYNVYSDISLPGFIRSVHPGNTSTPQLEPRRGEMAEGRVTRQIKRHFGLDADALRAMRAV